MTELLFWAGLFLLGVLPGLLLARLAPLGWDAVESLAAAPGLSLALISFAAYTAELLKLPVLPLPVLGVTGALLLLIWGAGRLDPRPRQGPPREALVGPAWSDWTVFLAAVVPFLALDPLRALAVIPPTLDDGLNHATWIRLIHDSASLSPSRVMAPLCSGNGPAYPWGLHAWVALLGHLGALPLMEVYSRAVQFLCCTLPLSVYVFSRSWLPRGWPCVAAAVAATLFWLVPFPVLWGGYALLAGCVCLPVLARLSLEVPLGWSVSRILAAGAVSIGLLLIHPSQAMGALVIVTFTSVALAANRRLPWRGPILFAALVAGCAILFTAGRHLPVIANFAKSAARLAAENTTETRWHYFWVFVLGWMGGSLLPLLCAVGFIAACFHSIRRVFALLFVAVVLMMAFGTIGETWLTLLWYHTPQRIWYLQIVALPVLAAMGVWALINLSSRALQAQKWSLPLLWPAALLGLLLASGRSLPEARRILAWNVVHSAWTDQRILIDMEWISAHLPPRAGVFNAPADWGLVLPLTGRAVSFPAGATGCKRRVPAEDLLDILRDPKRTNETPTLAQWGFQYVIASWIPKMVATWKDSARRPTLDVNMLRNNPYLELIYSSPSSALFRVRGGDRGP